MKYMAAFSIAFICVYFLIPPLRRLALATGFVDIPNERKIHTEPVPHLASIGIFAGFTVAFLLFTDGLDKRNIGFITGAVLVLGIGIIDDWYKTHGKDFPALPKAIVQIAAAIIAYFSGYVFTGFYKPVQPY